MWRKIQWVAIVAFLALLGAELGLRLILGLGNPPLLVGDDQIGYMFAANQDLHRFGHRVKINRYHQRSDDISEQPGAGVRRMLCVGDSVTWGGVLCEQRETYPEVLGRLLFDEGVSSPEVLNASAGSWGIGNQLAYLRRFGAFGSSVVVLQIGSGDLLQSKSNADCVGQHASFPKRKPMLAIGELTCRYILPQIVSGSPSAATVSSPEDKEGRFCRNMADFRACVRLVRQAGAEVVVFHNRSRAEILGGEGEGAREAFRVRFLAVCREEHIAVVDLGEVWRDDERVGRFFRDGVHLTEDGNAAAAVALLPVTITALQK
ncbi:MAG TPA: SGNH/GDSL hydrolase family protein [Sedimentisphaerales bacterium]|nr:SGNH/GDSL hydrolase family protein [Sedimentisphaerales bacterium]